MGDVAAGQRRRRVLGGRVHRLTVRLDEREARVVFARAAWARLTPASYLALAGSTPEPPGGQAGGSLGVVARRALAAELGGLARQVRGIGTNLNQLAHHANATQELSVATAAGAAQARVVLEEIEALVRRLDARLDGAAPEPGGLADEDLDQDVDDISGVTHHERAAGSAR